MAEDTANSAGTAGFRPGRTRSGQGFRAVGNQPMRTDIQTGNLVPATDEAVRGVQRPQSATTRSTGLQDVMPNIDIPRPKQESLVGTAATAVAGEVLKEGGKMAFRAGLDYGKSLLAPATFSDHVRQATMIGSGPTDAMGKPLDYTPVSTGGSNLVDRLTSGGDGFGDVGGGMASYADAAAVGDYLGGAADYAGMADMAEGANLADAAGGPSYIGSGMRLLQGDVKGAAGSAIGATLGSFAGPVGTVLGGIVGGMVGGGGGPCYITDAVMQNEGASDQAPELVTLRWFRDNVLARTPEGQALIEEYYRTAPAAVEAIKQHPQGQQALQAILTQYIQPAVQAIQAGQYDQALSIYAEMSAHVAELAMEATEDPNLEQMIAEFQEAAASVSHDAEIQGAATGSGQEMTHPIDERGQMRTSSLQRVVPG